MHMWSSENNFVESITQVLGLELWLPSLYSYHLCSLSHGVHPLFPFLLLLLHFFLFCMWCVCGGVCGWVCGCVFQTLKYTDAGAHCFGYSRSLAPESLSLPPRGLYYRRLPHPPRFHLGARDPNSNHQLHSQLTTSTRPSLQPPVHSGTRSKSV